MLKKTLSFNSVAQSAAKAVIEKETMKLKFFDRERVVTVLQSARDNIGLISFTALVNGLMLTWGFCVASKFSVTYMNIVNVVCVMVISSLAVAALHCGCYYLGEHWREKQMSKEMAESK